MFRFFVLSIFILITISVRADWAREQIGLYDLGPLDCSGVKIAYLDTGGDIDSPYLQHALWRNPREVAGNGIDDDRNGFEDDVHGYDFLNNTPNVVDNDGHGTLVAHTMAAVSDNTSARGLCASAQIMLLKVSDGGRTTLRALHRALDYAIDQRAEIILLTQGLTLLGGLPPWGLKRKIAKATARGSLFIHAAANLSSAVYLDSRPAHPNGAWPAFVPDRFHPIKNAISIGGSTREDVPWLGGLRHYEKVHLAAPAEKVSVLMPDGSMSEQSGNSIAAAFAAASAAAFWTANPSLTASGVLKKLFATSKKGLAYVYELKSGRLSLNNLMRNLEVKPLEIIPTGERILEEAYDPVIDKREWSFSKPGAAYVRVVFDYLDLSACWNGFGRATVSIYNVHDELVQQFVCQMRNSKYFVPSVFVKGDQLKVVFESGETINRSRFRFKLLQWSE